MNDIIIYLTTRKNQQCTEHCICIKWHLIYDAGNNYTPIRIIDDVIIDNQNKMSILNKNIIFNKDEIISIYDLLKVYEEIWTTYFKTNDARIKYHELRNRIYDIYNNIIE